ncbi:hypothetical protein J437_LFUL002037 [Ladona fulva]|uniref:Uncharacterized protein n=1 Tax=Ladona fulva TaxID=123851 RepID=A0A8K0JVG9_LADFU|nr:hypothetical protein J437_LFUL002037 [Ladona fulva]
MSEQGTSNVLTLATVTEEKKGLGVHGGWSKGSSPLERLQWSLQHDERWRSEVALGRRVGLYRIKGEIGVGNFSQVKMGIHQLTGVL